METGACSSNTPKAAKFYGLTTWNCEKGAESVGTGSIQFHDFLLVNNEVTGIEIKLLEKNDEYNENGPMIVNSVIASEAGALNTQPSSRGVIMPYGRGLTVKGNTFVNYASGSKAAFGGTSITGTTGDFNGGFTYMTEGTVFDNSPNHVYWRWENEGVYIDVDGSLTGVPGGRAVASTGTLPPTCLPNTQTSVNSNVPGSVCPSNVNFHRFSWNNPAPSSLVARNVTFTNQYGNTTTIWSKKRVTHPKGWMVLLVDAEPTGMAWVDSQQITNITYSGRTYDFNVRI